MYQVFWTGPSDERGFVGEYETWEEAVSAGEEYVGDLRWYDRFTNPEHYDYEIEDPDFADILPSSMFSGIRYGVPPDFDEDFLEEEGYGEDALWLLRQEEAIT